MLGRIFFGLSVVTMIGAAPLLAAGACECSHATSGVVVVPVASQPGTRVVYRQVVEPAAVVDRALAEQPVMPHLVEVRIVNTTTFMDPALDYSVKDFAGRGVSRTGHTALARIQQQHAARSGQPARVVRPAAAEQSPARVIRPTMIFLRPPLLPEPDQPLLTPVRHSRRLPQVADAELRQP